MEPTVTNIPPSRADFINAIRLFKQQHKVKLHHFIVGPASMISSEQALLRGLFFKEPFIHSYLSRSSSYVQFSSNKPLLSSNKNDKENSDYHESRIYALAQQAVHFLRYNRDINKNEFYESATNDSHLFRDITLNNTSIKIKRRGMDTYRIRKLLTRLELGKYLDPNERKRNYQFILFSNFKDGHASTILAIMQKEKSRLLAALFINSSHNNDYFLKTKGRFNWREGDFATDEGDPKLHPLLFSRIMEIVRNKLAGANLLVDTTNREAFAMDVRSFNVQLLEIKESVRAGKLDCLHQISTKDNTYEIYGERMVPFIDASHNLQTQPGDENCAIYSLNFLQAIINMFDSKAIAEKVYELALYIDSGTPEQKESAEIEITKIFQNDLKAYLPFYYEVDGTRKDFSLVKEHHLKQRWDLGSLGLNFEVLRRNGYLPPNPMLKL